MNRESHRTACVSAPRAAALALLLSLVACAPDARQDAPLRPVRSVQVQATGGTRVRTFSGTARPGHETQLSFRVGGKLESLNVKVGDSVGAGKLIARLDPRDYTLQVEKAQAALDAAQAMRRNADANLDRVRGMWENSNASRNDLDASLAAAQSASAQVEAARKSLELAQTQLGYTRLQAPVDGAIASVAVEVNENVGPGSPIVVVTSGARLEVEVAIPEQLIARIAEGDAVDVTFDALPGSVLEAIVTEVGVAPTGTATTFPVMVRLSRAAPGVRPGMAAEVAFRFAGADGRDRFYVRSEAVGEDREGRYVFVVEPADEAGVGIVRRVPVVVGELTPDGLEIFSGLADGQHVVTAGTRRISDGQRVKLGGSGGA